MCAYPSYVCVTVGCSITKLNVNNWFCVKHTEANLYCSSSLIKLYFHLLPRCCSDVVYHSHWLPKNVYALLPLPAQIQNRVPSKLCNDHVVCWTHEVCSFCSTDNKLLCLQSTHGNILTTEHCSGVFVLQ